MSLTTWSYLLAALNIGGLVLSWQVGNRKRWPWLGYIVSNAIWIVFAIDLHAWGLIASATAFIVVSLRNYAKWSPQGSRAPDRPTEPPPSQ